MIIRVRPSNLDVRTQTGISVSNPDIKNIQATIDITDLGNLFYYLEIYAEDSTGLRSESDFMLLQVYEITDNTWTQITQGTSTNAGGFNPVTSSTSTDDPINDGIPDDSDEDAFVSFSFTESFAFLTFIFYINIIIRRHKE